MTYTQTAAVPAPSVSLARLIAKVLHWAVFGWTCFCGLSFLMGLASVARTRTTSDAEAAGAAIGMVVGLGFWAVLWIVPVIGAELVAIALTLGAGKAPTPEVTKKEWLIAFLIALVPNGGLVLLLVIQFLSAAAVRR